MTNRQYIHGDYDKDGTKNIDDTRPFNKKKSKRVNPEVSLSTTIKYIEKKRRAAKKVAKPIAKKYGMNLNVLLKLNGLSSKSKIYPGQKLLVTADK